jgi:spermidine synthase
MTRAPAGAFDLVVLDAFSSDAIPVHLLTREALAIDRKALAPGGLVVVNITNRYLDLVPVVARLADDAGMACRVRVDVRSRADQERTGVMGSIWAVLAPNEADLGPLGRDPLWFAPAARPGERVWTDDHVSLIRFIRRGPVRGAGR